ncbi:MAG: hypothetical protein OXH02_05590 [Gemmatimonadetes bacterium]|nr:hypothetical protein [Gemmatimonadota bacterium]
MFITVSGADTVTAIPFETLPERAVMRVVPLLTAITRPPVFTVAMSVLLDDQATDAPVIGLPF